MNHESVRGRRFSGCGARRSIANTILGGAVCALLGGLLMNSGCTAINGGIGSNDDVAGQNADNLSPAGLPLGRVTIGDDIIQVEIAATAQTQQHGLMQRTALAPDAGMLFIFDRIQFLSFWMVNTLIPLDIAFIDADGTIINIDTMQPETTNLHDSDRPVLYALEVNAGEWQRRGIKAGDMVTIER